MIDYKRTNWYGWEYLCQHIRTGSVLPKTALPMLIAAIIGGWAASPHFINNLDAYTRSRDVFGETYGM
jgi:hypothetical protein